MRLLASPARRPLSYLLRSPLNPELLKTQQGRTHLRDSMRARFKQEGLLVELQTHYECFRKSLYEFEGLSKQANDIKRTIKERVKANGDVEALKKELASLKEAQAEKEQQLKQAKAKTEELLLLVGNSVHKDVVISKDQAQNRVLKYFNPKQTTKQLTESTLPKEVEASFSARYPHQKSYQDLNNMFRISDLGRGQKVSGHRGYFLCTNGVKLALAVAQYGLEFLQGRGYELYSTPALILQQVLKDSCQLNTIKTDMYRLPEDGLCLIATSEQTLAGYYRGEVLESRRLPLRMGGYSSCFRREAGAHGKDIHGLFRVHQFEKVEQFVVCHPSLSEEEMKRMVETSEQFYQSLSIPYRLVDMVSGQLNDPAVRKIDLQAWFPSQRRFRELVSVSNCTDYQSRLLQTRFREGPAAHYPHMLNGTLVAIQRAITCFLEHFYSAEKDELTIPEALQPFIRAKSLPRP